MENFWIWSIVIGTVFFVLGQTFLRYAFQIKPRLNNTSLYAISFFSITMGILGAILLGILRWKTNETLNSKYIYYILLAGTFFFIGNAFWLYSISSEKPLGIIRIVMAGWELLLLFAVGVLLLNDKITRTQVVGSILIFIGLSFIIKK